MTTREELAEAMLKLAKKMPTDTSERAFYWALADVAIEMMRPKLRWTEWRDASGGVTTDIYLISNCKLGHMTVSRISRHGDGYWWFDPKTGVSVHAQTPKDDTELAALRAEIEAAVREAMEADHG